MKTIKKNELIIRPIYDETIDDAMILAEPSLGECWNSKEDEEAFSYLQDE